MRFKKGDKVIPPLGEVATVIKMEADSKVSLEYLDTPDWQRKDYNVSNPLSRVARLVSLSSRHLKHYDEIELKRKKYTTNDPRS